MFVYKVWMLAGICTACIGLSVAASCQLASECVCDKEEIVCGETTRKDPPVFTYYERLMVTVLKLVKEQLPLLDNVCKLFPALEFIYVDGDTCPASQVTCARVKCS